MKNSRSYERYQFSDSGNSVNHKQCSHPNILNWNGIPQHTQTHTHTRFLKLSKKDSVFIKNKTRQKWQLNQHLSSKEQNWKAENSLK